MSISSGTFVNSTPTGTVALLGTAEQNQILYADTSTLADSDGLGTLSYQWLRDGVVINGASASSYKLLEADVGKAITLKVSYIDGSGTAEALTSAATAAVANVNDAPTGNVNLSGSLGQNSTLTAWSSTVADADGMGVVQYQWLRDGVAIAGATAGTYKLVEADVGHVVNVRGSYIDGHGTYESLTSKVTATIANVNDAPTGNVNYSGSLGQNSTLTAWSSTVADADGMGVVQYQWLRDGVAISGATAGTYKLVEADVGHVVNVRGSYIDGHGTYESLTSKVTATIANVNDAPTGGVSVSGTAEQNQTLTADTSALADLDGLGVLSFQWLRNGVAFTTPSTTASSYQLQEIDVGKAMSVKVSYTDGHGTHEYVTSAATAPVANVNDAPTGSVSISGTAELGQTLTAAHTLADADGLGAVTYQWLREGVATGFTGSSYTLGTADVGKTVSVQAAYVDGHGSAESLTSAATSAVLGDYLVGDAGGVARADVLHGGQYASIVDGRLSNDQLYGENGNDTVYGGAGNDSLYGGAGNDRLQGDSGTDLLTGGTGADVFVFSTQIDSLPTAAARDSIADFVHGEDLIDLSEMDANIDTPSAEGFGGSGSIGVEAFTELLDATAAFTAPGQLRFANGVLYGNYDSDADADFAIELLGVTSLQLSDLLLAH